MKRTLIDNSTDAFKMTTHLRELIANENVTIISIATGYWDMRALCLVAEQLKEFFERNESTRLRLLIGKDPYVYATDLNAPKYKDAKRYPDDYIRTDLAELQFADGVQPAIDLLLRYCQPTEEPRFEIRKYEKEFLHSKCYIFDGRDKGVGVGIIGSSNFTKKGLEDNAELNYKETEPLLVLSTEFETERTHKKWFEDKWKDATPWTQEFLEQVLRPAPIVKAIEEAQEAIEPFTPHDLYIKLLQLQFGDVIDLNMGQQIESYLPESVHRFDYQIEAVKRCLSIMHTHGGFMLGDVVGLGKTIIGSLIIKHFLSSPDPDGREQRVLIIAPPAIMPGWRETAQQFGMEDKIRFCSIGKIESLLDEDEDIDDDASDSGDFGDELHEDNYGLIIVDESHKFRRSETIMYKRLDNLIDNIYSHNGNYPYVGLLSATPQNNKPDDLKNQIYLFQRNHRQSTLVKAEGGNIETFFANMRKKYNEVISDKSTLTPEERKAQLRILSERIRNEVLADIMERRTRTDIERYYKDDLERNGITFPTTEGPEDIPYNMSAELAKLFYDTMTAIAPTEEERDSGKPHLSYARYRAIEYLAREEDRQKHVGRGNKSVNAVAEQLAGLMRIMLVKRLESSFEAFRQSLRNLRTYTNNMIRMWEENCIFVCPQFNVNKEMADCTFAEAQSNIRKRIEALNSKGRNLREQNAEYTCDSFKPTYIEELRKDRDLIDLLCQRWERMSKEDPKLETFCQEVRQRFFDPQSNTSGKLIIFSEAKDTVDALEYEMKKLGHKPLVVTSKNRKELHNTLRANFDANYTGTQLNDYDTLISTEVLAEGVNLHRANVVVNYDTPWNATRLMQRIGRINRIGSKHASVYVYNFYPSAQGDEQINLVKRAYVKLQSFHILFGEDHKVFSKEEEVMTYDQPSHAIEDEAESPTQRYIAELKLFRADNPQRYEQIVQAKDQWQMAVGAEGEAYFLVKAPRQQALSVRVQAEEAKVISLLQMIEALEATKAMPAIPIPQQWDAIKERALNEYSQHFVRLQYNRANDNRTKALGVIQSLQNLNGAINEESQTRLFEAKKQARKGDVGTIKTILRVQEKLNDKNPDLFKLTTDDIAQVLSQALGNITKQVNTKQGDPTVMLALNI